MPKDEVPPGKIVTYAPFVCILKPQKDKICKTCLTVGDSIISLLVEVSTTTAELPNTKILFNSVICTKYEKYLSLDVKPFYLYIPIDIYKYLKISL